MLCLFINLPAQTDRRQALEDSFRLHKGEGWSLQRIEAVAAADVAPTESLTAAERACYLSHCAALDRAHHADQPALILEDDSCLGPSSHLHIEAKLAEVADRPWDLLFTDLTIPDTHTMIELFHLRRAQGALVRLLNLAKLPTFCGAHGYVVNRGSALKVRAFLDEPGLSRLPLDIALRQLIWEARIAGYVAFPFVTSESELGDRSQIQPAQKKITDRVTRCFRQSIWVDADRTQPGLDPFEGVDPALFDAETLRFARIVTLALTPGFLYR